MKAAQAAQRRLVDLQELDSTLDRLAHRRRTLPEIARAAELTDRLTKLRDEVVAAETSQSDLQREQRKADSDVDQVRTRAVRDQQRLDSGAVASPKELENLQSEIVSLQKRQADLEEVDLDVMERLEEAGSRVAELAAEQDTTASELRTVEAARDEAFQQMDAEREQVAAERAGVAAGVPEDLRTLYEKLRQQFGGIGAAVLDGNRCGGCHLALNPAELARVRGAADDEVVRCDECRRIIIR